MSGNLVGGVVGAVIGLSFGNPAMGWMVGSTLGGLVAPTEGPKPPGLTDLRPQASEYSRPIPIVYSIMAIGGNVIWAQDLIKTSDGEAASGGKGGGGGSAGSAPTYAANFAILICESPGGVMRLGRIWAGPEKRLVYNPTGNFVESGTLRFYNGSEDQLPDSLIEADMGAGQVPAYRGYAYLVWEMFDVTAHDGNRIPFLTIEVGREGTVAPPTLGQFWANGIWETSDKFVIAYFGSYRGLLVNNKADMTLSRNITLDLLEWGQSDILVMDYTRNQMVRAHRPNAGASQDPHFYVTSLSTGAVTTRSLTMETGERLTGGCMANDTIVFSTSHNRIIAFDPGSGSQVGAQTMSLGAQVVQGLYSINQDLQTIFVVTAEQVYAFPVDGVSVLGTAIGAPPTGFDFTRAANGAIDPTTQYLWLVHKQGSAGGNSTIDWTVHDLNAGLITAGTTASSFFELAYVPWCFTPTAVWLVGVRWLAVDHYMEFTPSGAMTLEADGGYHGVNDLQAVQYSASMNNLTGIRFGAYYARAATGDTMLPHLPYITGPLNGADATLQTMSLAAVVADLCERAGLSSAQYDVTQLTDTVDGYTLANQVTIMDAIRTLMPAYYFDAVEDQGVLRFVKRGGALTVVIPDDDLGAHASGEEVVDLIEPTRGMDEELPHTVSVNYVLAATKYSPATKYDRKLVGNSGDEARLDMPMVFTDQKALEIASVNLHSQWIGRITYKIALGRKYSFLMPTDIVGVTVDGQARVMRLTREVQRSDGVIQFEAVQDDSDTYTPHVIVEETPPPDETVNTPSLTLLELM